MDNNGLYIICGWMINELHLKGNELLVYAIIYRSSQDGITVYRRGIGYLAESIGATKRTVISALSSLVSKKLITKIDCSSYKVNIQ